MTSLNLFVVMIGDGAGCELILKGSLLDKLVMMMSGSFFISMYVFIYHYINLNDFQVVIVNRLWSSISSEIHR